jgi:hypothetical protein
MASGFAALNLTMNTFLFKAIPFLEKHLGRLPMLRGLATQQQVSAVPVPPP